MQKEHLIKVDFRESGAVEGHVCIEEIIRPLKRPKPSTLGNSEKTVLKWILKKLGQLSVGQLADRSRKEKAWSETKLGESISYEYAMSLEI